MEQVSSKYIALSEGREEKRMKKVIDGKLYDTETAELVHEWSNGRYGNDFRNRSKDLYRTKKGNWFLYHVGGPMTDMARSCGNNSMSGSADIEPVSATDALRFLETHDGADVALQYFAEQIEEA